MSYIKDPITLSLASLRYLFHERKFIVFPIFSCTVCLYVMYSFVFSPISLQYLDLATYHSDILLSKSLLLWLICLYIFIYVLMTFLNAILMFYVSCHIRKPSLSTPSLSSRLLRHSLTLFIWAIWAATVGSLCRFIEEKFRKKLFLYAGYSWSVLHFFMVPTIMIQDLSPRFIKQPLSFLKSNFWIHGFVTYSGFEGNSILLSVLILPIFLFVPLTLFSLGIALSYICFCFTFILSLKTIFKTILFVYISEGTLAPGFSEQQFLSLILSRK